MTKSLNFALGINFDLLKTNLAAMYEKNEEGSKILLLPTTVNSPTSVTLEEMITDFKKAFGMSDDDSKKISDSLNGVKKEDKAFNIDQITFQLQAAFFYKNSPAKKENTPDTPKKESETASTESATATTPAETENEFTEYAFAVSVNMADALPDFGFIKLNSLFVAIWNTERNSVLRQIGAGQIDNMLKLLDA